jgi:hypothetical protein
MGPAFVPIRAIHSVRSRKRTPKFERKPRLWPQILNAPYIRSRKHPQMRRGWNRTSGHQGDSREAKRYKRIAKKGCCSQSIFGARFFPPPVPPPVQLSLAHTELITSSLASSRALYSHTSISKIPTHRTPSHIIGLPRNRITNFASFTLCRSRPGQSHIGLNHCLPPSVTTGHPVCSTDQHQPVSLSLAL